MIDCRKEIIKSSRMAITVFAVIGIGNAIVAYLADNLVVTFLAGVVVGSSVTNILDTVRSTRRVLASMDRVG